MGRCVSEARQTTWEADMIYIAGCRMQPRVESWQNLNLVAILTPHSALTWIGKTIPED